MAARKVIHQRPSPFFDGRGIHIGQVFHSFTPLPSPPPEYDDALALCVTTQWYGHHVHEFHALRSTLDFTLLSQVM